MDEIKITTRAEEASQEDIFWRDEQRKLIAGGPEIMDRTAQHTLTAVSFLTALYTAALSGLDIIKTAVLWFLIVSLAPLVVFIAAIVLAFFALFPKTHQLHQDSPDETKQFLQNLARKKKRILIAAAVCLVLGLALVAAVFMVYFLKSA